jgi:hypothetical protein
MGRACNTNEEKRNAYILLLKCQKVRDHWEGQNVDGWTILKLILEG